MVARETARLVQLHRTLPMTRGWEEPRLCAMSTGSRYKLTKAVQYVELYRLPTCTREKILMKQKETDAKRNRGETRIEYGHVNSQSAGSNLSTPTSVVSHLSEENSIALITAM